MITNFPAAAIKCAVSGGQPLSLILSDCIESKTQKLGNFMVVKYLFCEGIAILIFLSSTSGWVPRRT
jgi:hypothetical protein